MSRKLKQFGTRVPLRDRVDGVGPSTDAELPHCPDKWYHSQFGGIGDPGAGSLVARRAQLNPQRYCAWSDAMDDHDQLEYATASGNDYLGHEHTYRTFVTLTRSALAVIAVILILMAIFLT